MILFARICRHKDRGYLSPQFCVLPEFDNDVHKKQQPQSSRKPPEEVEGACMKQGLTMRVNSPRDTSLREVFCRSKTVELMRRRQQFPCSLDFKFKQVQVDNKHKGLTKDTG